MQKVQEPRGLTADALSNSYIGQAQKAASIKAFVDSQRRNASAYAIEGKKEFSRWETCNDIELDTSLDPSKDSQKAKAPSILNGFSSPVLKPRNAKCPEVTQLKGSVQQEPSNLKKNGDSTSKVEVRNKKSSSAAHLSRDSSKQEKEPVSLATKPSSEKKRLVRSKKPGSKKRVYDSDEDKEESKLSLNALI